MVAVLPGQMKTELVVTVGIALTDTMATPAVLGVRQVGADPVTK
jgi:hypothetical protein